MSSMQGARGSVRFEIDEPARSRSSLRRAAPSRSREVRDPPPARPDGLNISVASAQAATSPSPAELLPGSGEDDGMHLPMGGWAADDILGLHPDSRRGEGLLPLNELLARAADVGDASGDMHSSTYMGRPQGSPPLVEGDIDVNAFFLNIERAAHHSLRSAREALVEDPVGFGRREALREEEEARQAARAAAALGLPSLFSPDDLEGEGAGWEGSGTARGAPLLPEVMQSLEARRRLAALKDTLARARGRSAGRGGSPTLRSTGAPHARECSTPSVNSSSSTAAGEPTAGGGGGGAGVLTPSSRASSRSPRGGRAVGGALGPSSSVAEIVETIDAATRAARTGQRPQRSRVPRFDPERHARELLRRSGPALLTDGGAGTSSGEDERTSRSTASVCSGAEWDPRSGLVGGDAGRGSGVEDLVAAFTRDVLRAAVPAHTSSAGRPTAGVPVPGVSPDTARELLAYSASYNPAIAARCRGGVLGKAAHGQEQRAPVQRTDTVARATHGGGSPTTAAATPASVQASQEALVRAVLRAIPNLSPDISAELARQRRAIDHLTMLQHAQLRALEQAERTEARRRAQAPRVDPDAGIFLRSTYAPENVRAGLVQAIEPFVAGQRLQRAAADLQQPLPPLVTITTAPLVDLPGPSGVERAARLHERAVDHLRDTLGAELQAVHARSQAERRAFEDALARQQTSMQRAHQEALRQVMRDTHATEREHAELVRHLTSVQAVAQERRERERDVRHETVTRAMLRDAAEVLASRAEHGAGARQSGGGRGGKAVALRATRVRGRATAQGSAGSVGGLRRQDRQPLSHGPPPSGTDTGAEEQVRDEVSVERGSEEGVVHERSTDAAAYPDEPPAVQEKAEERTALPGVEEEVADSTVKDTAGGEAVGGTAPVRTPSREDRGQRGVSAKLATRVREATHAKVPPAPPRRLKTPVPPLTVCLPSEEELARRYRATQRARPVAKPTPVVRTPAGVQRTSGSAIARRTSPGKGLRGKGLPPTTSPSRATPAPTTPSPSSLLSAPSAHFLGVVTTPLGQTPPPLHGSTLLTPATHGEAPWGEQPLTGTSRMRAPYGSVDPVSATTQALPYARGGRAVVGPTLLLLSPPDEQQLQLLRPPPRLGEPPRRTLEEVVRDAYARVVSPVRAQDGARAPVAPVTAATTGEPSPPPPPAVDYFYFGESLEGEYVRRWKAYADAHRHVHALECAASVDGRSPAQMQVARQRGEEPVVHVCTGPSRDSFVREWEREEVYVRDRMSPMGGKREGTRGSLGVTEAMAHEAQSLVDARQRLARMRALLIEPHPRTEVNMARSEVGTPDSIQKCIMGEVVHTVLGEAVEEAVLGGLVRELERELLSAALRHTVEAVRPPSSEPSPAPPPSMDKDETSEAQLWLDILEHTLAEQLRIDPRWRAKAPDSSADAAAAAEHDLVARAIAHAMAGGSSTDATGAEHMARERIERSPETAAAVAGERPREVEHVLVPVPLPADPEWVHVVPTAAGNTHTMTDAQTRPDREGEGRGGGSDTRPSLTAGGALATTVHGSHGELRVVVDVAPLWEQLRQQAREMVAMHERMAEEQPRARVADEDLRDVIVESVTVLSPERPTSIHPQATVAQREDLARGREQSTRMTLPVPAAPSRVEERWTSAADSSVAAQDAPAAAAAPPPLPVSSTATTTAAAAAALAATSLEEARALAASVAVASLVQSERDRRDTLAAQEGAMRDTLSTMCSWQRAQLVENTAASEAWRRKWAVQEQEAAAAAAAEKGAQEQTAASAKHMTASDAQPHESEAPATLPSPSVHLTSAPSPHTQGGSPPIRDPVTRWIFDWLRAFGEDEAAAKSQREGHDFLHRLHDAAATAAVAQDGPGIVIAHSSTSRASSSRQTWDSWLSSTHASSFDPTGAHRFLRADEGLGVTSCRAVRPDVEGSVWVSPDADLTGAQADPAAPHTLLPSWTSAPAVASTAAVGWQGQPVRRSRSQRPLLDAATPTLHAGTADAIASPATTRHTGRDNSVRASGGGGGGGGGGGPRARDLRLDGTQGMPRAPAAPRVMEGWSASDTRGVVRVHSDSTSSATTRCTEPRAAPLSSSSSHSSEVTRHPPQVRLQASTAGHTGGPRVPSTSWPAIPVDVLTAEVRRIQSSAQAGPAVFEGPVLHSTLTAPVTAVPAVARDTDATCAPPARQTGPTWW